LCCIDWIAQLNGIVTIGPDRASQPAREVLNINDNHIINKVIVQFLLFTSKTIFKTV